MSDELISELDRPDVLTKYQDAGKIATRVMKNLVGRVIQGAKLYDLCCFGDKNIKDEVGKVYHKITDKGIAFPTCITKNNMVGYYAPKCDEGIMIEEGDLIKIELGVQIDQYPALLAYTIIVSTNNQQVTDKQAKVLRAVIACSKKIRSMMKPHTKNTDIVNEIQKCARKYDCSLLYTSDIDIKTPGIVSYQMSRGVINGHNDNCSDIHQLIIPRHNPEYNYKMAEVEFDENEVYAIDICMSSGTGKITQIEEQPSIYQRTDIRKELKLRIARETLNNFSSIFPMNIRDIDKKNYGLSTCIDEKVLEAYPIQSEKEGEYVGQIKFTVIVKDKPLLIAGLSSEEQEKKLA